MKPLFAPQTMVYCIPRQTGAFGGKIIIIKSATFIYYDVVQYSMMMMMNVIHPQSEDGDREAYHK